MSRFAEYVTNTAFQLTLGKTQITALAAVRAGDWTIAHKMRHWVTAIHGLEDRGLVESLPVYDTPNGRYAPGAGFTGNADLPFARRFKLTEEGKAVWQLLLYAKLVQEVRPSRSTRGREAA